MEAPMEAHSEATLEVLRELQQEVGDYVRGLREKEPKLNPEFIKGAEAVEARLDRIVESQTQPPLYIVELTTTVHIRAWSEDRAEEIASNFTIEDRHAEREVNDEAGEEIEDIENLEVVRVTEA